MESQSEFWNIDPASGALLQALIFTQKPKNILEVGTSNGYSAILMGKIASLYGGKITTIEFFQERANLAKMNIAHEKLLDSIEIVCGDAIEILSALPQIPSYDLIFLDANKEEYAQYFQYSLQVITPGGIVIADNTVSHAHKLTAFFEIVANEPRAHALELSIGTGLLLIRVD